MCGRAYESREPSANISAALQSGWALEKPEWGEGHFWALCACCHVQCLQDM